MNPVAVHQRERASQVRLGTPLTVVAKANDRVLQNSTEVAFLEKSFTRVPDQRPMRRRCPVLVQPALGTQKLCLNTVATSNVPYMLGEATTAGHQKRGVMVSRKKGLEENRFLGFEFIQMGDSLRKFS